MPLSACSSVALPGSSPSCTTVNWTAPGPASAISHVMVEGGSPATCSSQRASKLITSRRGGSLSRISPAIASLPSKGHICKSSVDRLWPQ